MYPTSDNYKRAIKGTSVDYKWYGTITFKDGLYVTFNNQNIDQNKSKITKQVVSGENLEIGNVFSSELKLTLRDSDDWQISSKTYNFYDAIITLNFRLEYVDNGTTRTETVPCGMYKITEAERTYHTVSLVAYDYASNFNTKLAVRFSETMSPYDAISAICGLCNVQLGMTEAQVMIFPNGDRDDLPMNIYKKGTSYKEILGNICTLLSCNAVIDRSGRLILAEYGKISVRALTPSERYSTSYVDYIGHYTTLYVVNKKGEVDDYAVHSLLPYRELAMNIGKNTLFNKYDSGDRDTIADNILTYLYNIVYSPCSVTMPCDPSIDIGDMISVIGGEINGTYTKTLDTEVHQDKQYYMMRVVDFSFDFEPVTPVGDEDPYSMGWYEVGAGVLCTKIEIPLYGQMKITSEAGSYELDVDPYATEKEQEKKQDTDDQNDKWEEQEGYNGENDEKWEEQEQHNNDTDESLGDMGESLNNLATKMAVNYVFPYEINTNPIGDGGSANVLRFRFKCDRDGDTVAFYSMVTFAVSTTSGESFNDCNLTVRYVLDGAQAATAIHTYTDGNAILTLNGCFAQLTAGDHTFDVQFALSGGGIS